MAQTPIQAQANTQIASGAGETNNPPRRIHISSIMLYVLLALFTLTSLVPLLFAFISSFKTQADVLAFPPSLIPNPFILSNYSTVFGQPIFLRWILNTLVYAGGVVILNVLFSAMAGYALSRMNFPGKNLIFVTTLSVMMIPSAVTLIPKFLVANAIHVINTPLALILPAMAQPLAVFIMVQFMKNLPKELEESAMLDGASRWRTFYSIILPLVRPALTAVAIVSFQGAWNDFQWPLVALGSQDQYTLPLGLFFFKSANYTLYNLLLAGSMFNLIPIVILFFIFQRYFMGGALGSAVKG
jgi:ABC-type glycerol-3-phosphate transport system permease component